MAMAMESEAKFLRSVAIVFRHGSRGFTQSSRTALLKHGSASPQHACLEWSDAELEHITEVGSAQMRALGGWFATRFARTVKTRKIGAPLKWRSSLTPRVVESGRIFLEGAAGAGVGVFGDLPGEPSAYGSDADADAVFRNWHVDPTFLAATATVKSSEEVRTTAQSVAGPLHRLYAALSGVPAVAADTAVLPAVATCALPPHLSPPPAAAAAAAASADSSSQLAVQLFQTTYVKELFDCEVFWPETSAALRDNVALEAKSYTAQTDAPPVPGVKANLLSRITPGDEAFMLSAAAWVWEQRFFRHSAVRNLGRRIGGALLQELLADCATGDVPFSAYSAHDYTLLALLAALKVPKHPSLCVGFGSFMLFETYEAMVPRAPPPRSSGPASSFTHRNATVTIRMCAEPFPMARAKAGYPSDLDVTGLETVAEDVSLDSLLHLVRSWR